ncbi:MAG: hypothetical protein H6Q99_4269 [Proteobacteria bacterium]|nr:hypothetical protein [Pseudomonadota bacterium]
MELVPTSVRPRSNAWAVWIARASAELIWARAWAIWASVEASCEVFWARSTSMLSTASRASTAPSST